MNFLCILALAMLCIQAIVGGTKAQECKPDKRCHLQGGICYEPGTAPPGWVPVTDKGRPVVCDRRTGCVCYKMEDNTGELAMALLPTTTSDCTLALATECAVTMAKTAYGCRKIFTNPTKIFNCMREVYGTGSLCYPCICYVMELLLQMACGGANKCLEQKTVEERNYTLIIDSEGDKFENQDCHENCLYSLNENPETRFCFAEHSVALAATPSVTITNNLQHPTAGSLVGSAVIKAWLASTKGQTITIPTTAFGNPGVSTIYATDLGSQTYCTPYSPQPTETSFEVNHTAGGCEVVLSPK